MSRLINFCCYLGLFSMTLKSHQYPNVKKAYDFIQSLTTTFIAPLSINEPAKGFLNQYIHNDCLTHPHLYTRTGLISSKHSSTLPSPSAVYAQASVTLRSTAQVQ